MTQPTLFTKKETPTIRDVSEAMLARYYDLNERRKKLERDAEKLDKEQELLRTEIAAAMLLEERTDLRRGNYEAEMRDGPKFPRWKDAFIKALGAEAAADVEKRTKTSTRFTVRKLA